MINRPCYSCKKTKPISEFGLDKTKKNGIAYRCKVCERLRDKGRRRTLSRRFQSYKSGAKHRNIKFCISKKTFGQLTYGLCKYCGGFSGIDDGKKFCGLDRVDSNKPYVQSNLVPCCDKCNKLKGIFQYEEFISLIKKIANNIGG